MAVNPKSAFDCGRGAASNAPSKQLSPLAAEFVPSLHKNNVKRSGSKSSVSKNTNNHPKNNMPPGRCLSPFLPPSDEDEIDDLVDILPAPNDHTTLLFAPNDDPFMTFPRWAYKVGHDIRPTKRCQRMLEYLRTAIQALKYNSVRFETVAADVPSACKGLRNNYYVLSNVIEDIFDESVINAGFRFVASKLLQLLYMLNPRQPSLFGALLRKKLPHQHDMLERFMVTRQQGKARNTALFLTEVCIQLRGDNDTEQLIACTLMQCLWPLVSTRIVANVQCASMVLKTVGHDLILLCNESLIQMVCVLEETSSKNPGMRRIVAGVSSLMRFDWKQRWRDAQYVSTQFGDEFDFGESSLYDHQQ